MMLRTTLNRAMLTDPSPLCWRPLHYQVPTVIRFAVAPNTLERIAPQLIEHGKVEHTSRAVIGVYTEKVSPELAAHYGLPVDH